MNNYLVQIQIMPLKNLLDPQGKAVEQGLHNLGLTGVVNVRVGKQVQLSITAKDEAQAYQIAEDASVKLLANAVMEYFEIESIVAI
jgi:phosphoribosylformylglycinamidine synthase PurS subunit